MSATTKYQGRIPVVFLSEDADQYTRVGERIAYELNSDLVYYLNLDRYKNLTEEQLIDLKTRSADQDCLSMTVKSMHGEAQLCLDYKDGSLINLYRLNN